MNTTLSTDGLTSQISTIVAEASMQLPSLVHSHDADFLKHQANHAISIFLREVMVGASPKDRARFNETQMSNDAPAAGVMLFEALESEGAEVRVSAALDVVRIQINSSIAEDYRAFTAHITSGN